MYIGIDIGGTKCSVVYGNEKGEILNKEKFATSSYEETLEKIFKAVEKCGEASAVGISCGGPLDSEKGIILSPPNLPGWDEIHIIEMIEEKFKIPAGIENDANACALAEFCYGAGKGCKNMIFLTFGTGLGAGLILDGKLYRGTNGMAGEVGHIRLENYGPVGFGKMGSFESFCSGGGIAQIGRAKAMEQLQMGRQVSYCQSLSELDNITAQKIAEAAKAGDEISREVYNICARKLGLGLSIMVDILNPERIVLGSIYPRAIDLLEKTVIEVMEKEALYSSNSVCRVVPAMLGEQIGDYAALAVAASISKENL